MNGWWIRRTLLFILVACSCATALHVLTLNLSEGRPVLDNYRPLLLPLLDRIGKTTLQTDEGALVSGFSVVLALGRKFPPTVTQVDSSESIPVLAIQTSG